MSRLSAVLEQYKVQEEQERLLPYTHMQYVRLDNALADILGQSNLKSYKELLIGLLEDPKLFKELDKAETPQEALKMIVDFLSKLLDDYIAKPDSFFAPLNTDYLKNIVDRYSRLIQPEVVVPKEVEKEGEEATPVVNDTDKDSK